MIYLLICLLLGGGLAFISGQLFGPELHNWKQAPQVFKYAFFLNTLALLAMRYVFGYEDIVLTLMDMSSWVEFVLYLDVIVVLGVGYILIRKYGYKSPIKLIKENHKLTPCEWSGYSIMTLIIVVGLFVTVGATWFVSTFGKITPEQLSFQLTSTTDGADSSVMNSIWNGPVIAWILMVVLNLQLLWGNWTLVVGKWRAKEKRFKIVVVILQLATVFGSLYFAGQELRVVSLYRSRYTTSEYVKDNYVSPDQTKLMFPEKKRNLIHIYLESYENSYFEKKDGGYMETNLMPELQKLSDEGVHFSDTEKFGGPQQTYGSSWSVAGMVNMSAGVPLKVSAKNRYGRDGIFLPGATTIGDILKDQGYNNMVMFGSDADFGGLTTYYKTHGKYDIFDVSYARANDYIPVDYEEFWGFEDKKLYEFAKEQITKLSEKPEPFNFVMENADTHFPNGYVEEGMAEPFDMQYANVIFHSQAEVEKFVRWIQDQPFYKDTTVVLTGDHLSMDKKFFRNFDPEYKRTTYNLILNGASPHENPKTQNRQYASFDYFPTILSNMGVKIDGDRLGLGTDLMSDKETLLERDGLEYFDSELERRSPFYEKELVSPEGHEDRVTISQVENFNNTYGHILPEKTK